MDYDIPRIQGTRLFSGFSELEVRLVFEQCAELREVTEDQIIIEAGTHGREIYYLAEGSVRTEIPLPPYPPAALATLQGPITFGEISYLDGGERSVTVRAAAPLSLHVIDGQRLDALFLDLPHTQCKLHRNIALSLTDIVRNNTRHFHDGVMKLRTAQSKAANQVAGKYYDMISRLAGNIS